MSSSVKKLARRFRRDYMPLKPTAEAVASALEQQGYTLVPFNSAYNEGPTDTIIRALKLQSYVQSAKGFTYADSSHRLVFIHEGLGQWKKLLVLLHEQGHILCQHFSTAPIVGHEVVQEFEANEFAHHVLYPGFWGRLGLWCRHHKALTALLLAIPLLLCVGLLIHVGSQKTQARQTVYYVTQSGQRYHEPDCSAIQGRDNITGRPLEELEEQGYTPCERCHPGE